MSEQGERKSPHEQFAERIIAALKTGTAPWIKPWRPGEYTPAINAITGRPYHGINQVVLSAEGMQDPRFLTLKQANDQGWRVRKGEKSLPIAYWQFSKREPVLDDHGQPMFSDEGKQLVNEVRLARPLVRTARVFHISQIEGDAIPPYKPQEITWDANTRAEAILDNSGAVIAHDQRDRAFYNSMSDDIHLPPKDHFPTATNYYGTALHELSHWTGHPSRLNRDLGNHPFGSPEYAREELRAEIGSWMVSMELGLGHDPSRHLSYVASWIKALEQDPFEIVRACRDAEKIKEFTMAFEKKLDQEKDMAMPNAGEEMRIPESSQPEKGHTQEIAKEKTWLAVPYSEKEQAKKAGARWDRKNKSWFAPEGSDLAVFSPWLQKQPHKEMGGLTPEQEFAEALRNAGLDLKGELPIMDGQLHRAPLLDGSPNKNNGTYKGFLDGRPAGYVENWKTGEKLTWKYTGHVLDQAEVARIRAEAAQKQAQRAKALEAQHEHAAKRCFAKWKNAAGWADKDQQYLTAKEVLPFGVKVDEKGNLLIPGRDVDGFIHTLQTITPEGKEFEAGARKTGTMHVIDPRKELGKGPILIAEGYATAATVHMATQRPVICAFDSGNLAAVSQALHDKYPTSKIVFCADHDRWTQRPDGTPWNPGIEKACAAAEAVQGKVLVPEFGEDLSIHPTDFNDLSKIRGLKEVGRQIEHGLQRMHSVQPTIKEWLSKSPANHKQQALAR